MPTDFIPSNDDEFDHTVTQLYNAINPTPTAYGFTVAQWAAFTTAYNVWVTDWAAFLAAKIAYEAATATKNTAREAINGETRTVNNLVQANPAITDAQKTDAGLPIHKTTHTPAPVPSTRPVLYRVDNEPSVQRLWFADELKPGDKSKPAGVKMCEIRQSIVPAGGAAPTNPNTMPLLALDTKSPHRTDFDPDQKGQTAFYAARWINTRGEPGPWGAITNYLIL